MTFKLYIFFFNLTFVLLVATRLELSLKTVGKRLNFFNLMLLNFELRIFIINREQNSSRKLTHAYFQ